MARVANSTSFKKGAPGRPKGAKNKITARKEIEAQLLAGKEEIIEVFLEMVKAGDPAMMKLYIDKVYPTLTLVQLTLIDRLEALEEAQGIGSVVADYGPTVDEQLEETEQYDFC